MPAISDNKRITKNTLLLYVRMLLSMFIGFFTSRILLNQLGIVDFGIYNVIGGVLVILGFLNTTLSLSTQRFINFYLGQSDNSMANKVFNISMVIHSTFSLIIFIIAETAGLWFINTQMNIPADRMFTANIVYQVTVISSIIGICQVPFISLIIAHENMSQYATISIIDIILRFMAALTLIFVDYDKLRIYSFLILLIAIINFFIYSIYSKYHFPETKFKMSRDKTFYKKMLSFSGWNIFSAISIALNGQIVNVLLNIFFGPTINAARGVAMQASGSISGFVGNFQIAVNPQIIKLYAANELEKFHKLIKQSAKFSFFLLLIFALPVSIKIEEILQIWLVQVPDYSPIFCQIILITNLINTFSLPLATAANATGNIKKFQLSTGCIELLNIPFAYILLLADFPPYYVFLVSTIITMTTLVIRLVILKSLISLNVTDYISTVIFRSLLTMAIAGIISFILDGLFPTNSIITVILYIISIITITLLVILIVGMNHDERLFIKNTLFSKFKK